MGRTFIRQETQIRKSDTYDDTITPSLANYETNPVDIEDDLNTLRSQVQNLINRDGASFPSGNWYDDLTQPTTLENGTIRGIDAVNDALHIVEKKRVLRDVVNVGTDITVGGSDNFVILALAELPSNTTAAIGSVTTLGTVAAYNSSFGANDLAEVAGPNALEPKNLMAIVDADTGDPILSSGRKIWGLFQTESNTDGSTMTGTTPNRAQISFVRPNATFDDLEACPAADIQGKDIQYSTRERVRLEDLTEADFLRGAVVDVGAGSGTITRQVAYDNQGTTPVDLTTNATLDLEGAGLVWAIRDDAEATLFAITEGSSGGTSKVAIEGDVDIFDVNAVTNDFLNGASFDTGAAGTTINVGVTANQIDSGGTLDLVTAAASQLKMASGGRLAFTDQYEPAGWSLDGIALSDSAQEWTDFETAFGEVSLLSAIKTAYESAHRRRVFSVVSVANIAANTDASGPSDDNNLDADLGDLSGGTFVDDYDVFLNGELLRPGADAAANHDYYPGTSLANGQLKFEFVLKINDVLCVIDHVA